MSSLPYFLYHCHRLNKEIKISQEQAVIDGKKYLIRHPCPYMNASEDFNCNGLNDYSIPCCHSTEEKQLID